MPSWTPSQADSIAPFFRLLSTPSIRCAAPTSPAARLTRRLRLATRSNVATMRNRQKAASLGGLFICAEESDESDSTSSNQTLAPDLAEHVGFQEALDEQHEQDRRKEKDQRRDRGDLVIAAHAGAVKQER